LTPAFVQTCASALPAILADGPRTRAEIDESLAAQGIRYSSDDPQARVHMLAHASFQGLICRGPDRGRTATWVLLDSWVPAAPAGPRGDDALAELARRYFRAYSPATAADLSTWSGLAGARAVSLIRDELEPVSVDGRSGFRLGPAVAARSIRLLPAFDNYLIGYRERGFVSAARPEVYVGGIIRPTLLVDGVVRARWQLTHDAVQLTPFGSLPRSVLRAVDAEIADVARFVGRPLGLSLRA